MIDYSIQGFEALSDRLKAIPHDLKFKGGRFALRRAAELVRAAAAKNALAVDDPQSPEKISENVVLRWSNRRFKRNGDLMFRVGILGGARAPAGSKQERKTNRRRARTGAASLESLGEIAGAGAGNPGGDTFHWRFVEFGTEKMPAQPFMRRSLSDNTGNATNEFINQYGKSLDRLLKRLRKK